MSSPNNLVKTSKPGEFLLNTPTPGELPVQDSITERRIGIKKGVEKIRGEIRTTRISLATAIVDLDSEISSFDDPDNFIAMSTGDLAKKIKVDEMPGEVRPVIIATIEGLRERAIKAKQVYKYYSTKSRALPGSNSQVNIKQGETKVAGKLFFSDYLHQEPNGPVGLYREIFAVSLWVINEKDAALSAGDVRGIGGYYKDKAKITPRPDTLPEDFPLIVVNMEYEPSHPSEYLSSDSSARQTYEHEHAHGIHATVVEAMREVTAGDQRLRKILMVEEDPFKEVDIKYNIIETIPGWLVEHVPLFRKWSAEFGRMMSQLGKNELLASLYGGQWISQPRHLRSGVEKGEHYKYFELTGFSSLPGPVVEMIRKSYLADMNSAVEAVSSLRVMNDERDKIIWALLLTEPLGRWSIFINKYFGREIKLAEEIRGAGALFRGWVMRDYQDKDISRKDSIPKEQNEWYEKYQEIENGFTGKYPPGRRWLEDRRLLEQHLEKIRFLQQEYDEQYYHEQYGVNETVE